MNTQMKKKWKYDGSDNMSELVEGNSRVLLVMSRFGIGLGFGEASIDEVCVAHGVDTETFLAVVNMMLAGDERVKYDTSNVSPQALLDYLINSHNYYTEFRLPGIRKALVEVLDNPDAELSRAVIHYFDEYVSEVRKHMNGEEKTLFPHLRSLIQGKHDCRSHTDDSHKKHDRMQVRLAEFKKMLIKYYPTRSTNSLNSVLLDIYNCEHDLVAHNKVEDRLLIPIITDLERKIEAETDD
jgi:regulator of cell morphogenesis and NO signaling